MCMSVCFLDPGSGEYILTVSSVVTVHHKYCYCIELELLPGFFNFFFLSGPNPNAERATSFA